MAQISLKRIRENATLIKRAAGAPLIAVVKDDAYGHGAERVALALHGVADAFAVATVDEGASLRCAGVSEDILVLTPPLCREEVLRISSYNMIAPLTSFFVLKLALSVTEEEEIPLRVHIAVNTGMNRYGFQPRRIAEVLKKTGTFSVEGVFSHLYAPASEAHLNAQMKLFQEAADRVKEIYPDAKSHLAATGGILAGVKADMVRAGIALYGYSPDGFKVADVKPAMKIYASVAHNGRTVGNGLGYKIEENMPQRAHTLRLGYGDGFFRDEGKLCMDAAVVSGYARTGTRKLVLKDVSEYAKRHNTTEYEALVNVSRRADKSYDE
ncbi:MAG: alanine racemase [Clostridia bacterium]|nr:alanine racemase [Clostridia bacterium]